jgi:pimeloyl-ACP methyl ester carboxylesterase
MTARAGYAFLLLMLFCGQAARPTKVRVGGVELHYVERGSGEPLILLHGGQGDYGTWGLQVDELSRSYRVFRPLPGVV